MGAGGEDIITACRLDLTAPLYYLLVSNGYPRKAALDLLYSRDDIIDPRPCRNLSNRCIHPETLNEHIRKKRADPRKVSFLAIDLLNVTATIYAILHQEHVFECTDGLLRDILSSKQAIRGMRGEIESVVAYLKNAHTIYPNLRKISIIIDSQIPWSRRISAKLHDELDDMLEKIEAIVSPRADTMLIEASRKGYTVATSDIVVLQNVESYTDLPAELVRAKLLTGKILSMPKIILEGVDEIVNKSSNTLRDIAEQTCGPVA